METFSGRETAIKKSLYKAFHELERFQKKRLSVER